MFGLLAELERRIEASEGSLACYFFVCFRLCVKCEPDLNLTLKPRVSLCV